MRGFWMPGRKALETVELEQRIAALEQRHGKT